MSGTVTSSEGEPLIGVSVQIQGSSSGTITDLDGNYTLAVPADGVLLFSFLDVDNDGRQDLSANNARVSSGYSNPVHWRPAAPTRPVTDRNFTVVNPATGGRLVLTADLARQSGIELSLYDAAGRERWSAEVALPAGVTKTAYDVVVPAGCYWLRIGTGEATEIRPVIFIGF